MKRRGWLLALSLFLLTPQLARADRALVTGDLNLRLGPGSDFAVIDSIPAGSTVDLLGCRGIWCEIYIGRGASGFVSRSFLDFGAFPPPRRARPLYRPHRHALHENRTFRRPRHVMRSPRAAPRGEMRPPALRQERPPAEDRAPAVMRPLPAPIPPVVTAPRTKPPALAPVAPYSPAGPDQPTGSRAPRPEKPFSIPKDAPEISL